MAKKKTVVMVPPPTGELPTSAEVPLASALLTNGQPLPVADTEPALLREPVNESVAEPPSALLEPGPQLAPGAPVPEAAPPIFDLALAPPVAQPLSLAVPTSEPAIATLVQRIERLEEALSGVQNLQAIEQRVAERVATQLQREKPAPAAESGSPVLAKAAALLGAGKHLIPSLVRQDAPPTADPQPHAHAHPESSRMWLVWEMIAEARAILRMYLDPRWSLTWIARTVPPVLLGAFVLIHYWLPFAIVPIVGPIIEKVGELVIGFMLI